MTKKKAIIREGEAAIYGLSFSYSSGLPIHHHPLAKE
jgi:hypothetical protein